MFKRISLMIIAFLMVAGLIFIFIRGFDKKPVDLPASNEPTSADGGESSSTESAPPASQAASQSPSQVAPSATQVAPSASQGAQSRAQASQPNVAEQAWKTRLVNTANLLPGDFVPPLSSIEGYTDRKFDTRAVQALNDMLRDANAAGYPLYVVSSYRSIEYQRGLYNRKVDEYKRQGYNDETAKAEAAKWVTLPGASEHNLGLAVDIVSGDWYTKNSDLTEAFAETPHYKWLIENCANYGFVLRYPSDKTAVTGINYEPWHYRYVGSDAAKAIMAAGTCLEEYHA